MQCVSPSFDLEGLVGIRNQILKTRFTLNGERKMRYFTDVEQGDKAVSYTHLTLPTRR